MPGVDALSADDVREALRQLGEDESVIAGGSRRVLRDRLGEPGRVADLIDRAPDGAAAAFRQLAVDGAASVQDLLGRGWAGVGRLPAPLDWLQRRGLVTVGQEGLVHAVDEARRGFTSLTLDLPMAEPEPEGPYVVEAVATVVVAPSPAALDRATAITGASLRAVSPTVAVSDRRAAAVQAALESGGAAVTGSAVPAVTQDALHLPGTEEDAVGPRAIRRLLQRAMAEHRQVRLEYFASSRGGQATERVVDPWEFTDDLLRGYCHLRQDERAFAVDRIGRARLLQTQRSHGPQEERDG